MEINFINLKNIIIFIFVYFCLLIILYLNSSLIGTNFTFQSIILLITLFVISAIIYVIYYFINYYYSDIEVDVDTKDEKEKDKKDAKCNNNKVNKVTSEDTKKTETITITHVDEKKPSSKLEKYDKEEVFHVHNNIFTYKEAKALCKSYNSKLASLEQIKDAYREGADWCNYGWSQNQNAYYPTQQQTYDEMQKDPKTKYNCGKPGINGGYFDNPKLRFGVNCYGIKPGGLSKPFKVDDNGDDNTLTPKDLEKMHKDLTISTWDKYKWSEYSKVSNDNEFLDDLNED